MKYDIIKISYNLWETDIVLIVARMCLINQKANNAMIHEALYDILVLRYLH